MVVKKDDWATPSHKKLHSLFHGVDTIEKFLTVFASSHEEIDAAAEGLFNSRDIDSATGAQLELLGNLVGAERGQLSDEVYRAIIKATVVVNSSDSTYPTLTRIIDIIYSDAANYSFSNVNSRENLVITATEVTPPNGVTPELVGGLLCKAKAAGTEIKYHYVTSDTESFCFEGGDGLGFGDANAAATGGEISGMMAVSKICNPGPDTVLPVVIIERDEASVDIFTDPGTITFTVTLFDDRKILTQSLTADDITITGTLAGAVAGAPTVSGANPYTVTIPDPSLGAPNPASGTLGITVAADVVTDTAGQSNIAVETYRFIEVASSADVEDPEVTVVPVSTSLELGADQVWTVTYSDDQALEASPELVMGDLSLTGAGAGTLSTITGSNPYTVTATGGTAEGVATLEVLAGAVQDAQGNSSAAVTSADITVTDTVAPTVTIVHDPADSQLAVDVASPRCAWTVTFSDAGGLESPLPTLTSSNFSITAGEAWQLGSYTWDIVDNGGGEWQVAIEGMEYVGDATLVVDALAVYDAAGNGNLETTAASPVRMTATPFTVTATFNSGASDLVTTGDGVISINYDISNTDAVSAINIHETASYSYTGTATFSSGPTAGAFPADIIIDATTTADGTLGATVTYVESSTNGPGTYRQGFNEFTLPTQTLSSATAYSTFVDTPLTINGTDYSADYVLRGDDASGTSWSFHTGSATALATSAAGSVSTAASGDIDGLTLVTAPSSEYLSTPTEILNLAAGEDVIIEIISEYVDVNNRYFIQSATNTSSEGFVCRGTARFVISVEDDGGVTHQRVSSLQPTIGSSQLYYHCYILRRDGSNSYAHVYNNINGIRTEGPLACTGAVGTTLGETRVLGTSGLTTQLQMGHIGIYKATDFDTYTEAQIEDALDARVVLLGGTVGVDF